MSRRSAWILFGLVALALLLDFIFFTGFFASDDMGYIEGARGLCGETEWEPGLANTRIGLTIPAAIVYKLTGSSLGAMLWFQVVYHLALVVISYVLGRLLLDERAGLIAAGLMAINPLIYVFAGAMLPDNAAVMWLGLSMIALIATKRFADPGTTIRSWNRDRFKGYFIAGLMLGACYECKETALIMTIPAAVFIMTAGPSFKSLVWVQNGAILAAGLVTAILLELIILRVVTGDFVNRLTLMRETGEGVFQADMARQGVTPFARFGYAKTQVESWMPLSLWILLAGSIAYGFTRARNVGVQLFFWWPTIYLTIGSTRISEYLPPTIQARYYAFAILPAVVMTAIAFSTLLARWPNRRTWVQKLQIVIPLALVGIYECGHNLPKAGTLYFAPDVASFTAALEEARERYPKYTLVASAFYSHRMPVILDQRHDIMLDPYGKKRPAPPYVYIRSAGEPVEVVAAPPLRADRVAEIPAPANRWVVIKDALRRMTTTKLKPKMKSAKPVRGAEIWLVRGPLTAEPKETKNPGTP